MGSEARRKSPAAQRHNCAVSPAPKLQVHEKSILLPLLPLSILLGREQPHLLCWVNAVAVFSMLPLLKKDGLALAAAGATAACHAAIQLACAAAPAPPPAGRSTRRKEPGTTLPEAWLQAGWRLSLAGCAAILAASALVPPPPKLPFLYDALTVTWAFLHFAALWAWTLTLQLREFRAAAATPPAKAKRR